ncbi:hypothetical protein PVL30_005341 [Lodderomyces elongisporus]|uniref:uncharacterized protein n=1 Tax=Lodderomyces elongisporus TaxID=36914 RepID=UPI002925D1A1|nr:uncharacterized protein PVL30_005341 [Lodderomyces elongisporus]WLF81543.1 hypothetical protein PVL30_005341 [Lodderomyces elongisporus]
MSTATAAPSKTYKEMIKEAISTLKERNGSSRQSLKKYVQSNFQLKGGNFDSLFNSALRKGVEAGDFVQPKGPSGPVKLKKKEPVVKEAKAKKDKDGASAKKATKKAGTKDAKATKAKKDATKKDTTKKTTTATKAKKEAAGKVTKPAATKKKAAASATGASTTKKAAPAKKVAKK